MKRALENAIFYSHDYHTNVISEHTYSNKEDFSNIIKNFGKNIEIRNIFGNHDNICYDICNNISYYYDNLLLGNVAKIYITSRRGNSICLINSNNKNKNLAIIPIDAVLTELNINQDGVGWTKYLWLGIAGFYIYYRLKK